MYYFCHSQYSTTMQYLKRYVYVIVGLLLTLGLWCFFAFGYWGHLTHAEEYQLFLFTADYFNECVASAGGLTNYVGRFLTQFFLFPSLGALIVALLYGSLYFGTLLLFRDVTSSRKWFIAALASAFTLLSTSLWVDITAVYSGTVAVVLTLWSVVLWHCLPRRVGECVLPLLTFVLFWVVGGFAALTLVVFAVVDTIVVRRRSTSSMLSLGLGLAVAVVMPFFARSLFGVQMPLQRTFFGADLSRFIAVVDPMVFVIYGVLMFLPLARLAGDVRTTWRWGIGAAVVALGGVAMVANVSFYNETSLRFYTYARNSNWNAILQLANKKSPTNKASLLYLNLALGKTNTLGDNMFRYSQYGTDGLLHPFIIETSVSVALSDIYYHLGFINSSERLAFEGMKAVSDYQESARCMERLAEVNMIKGDYRVAIKYYSLLEKSLFYREKARKGLDLARRATIDGQIEWQAKRKGIIDTDIYFSEGEQDMMLGMLFQSDRANKLAFDYLMAYCLLDRDVEHYVKYAPIGGHLYSSMPKAFREAYIYYLSLTDPKRLMGNEINALDRAYINRMQQFRNIYVHNKKDPRLQEQFADTYWYYLLSE